MSNRTIESTLDGWKTFADSDLSQHALTRAVSKLAKKTRETESLSDKLPLSYKIARERPLTDPLCYPSGGTEVEKEAWEAREARLWIEKVKPIYVEDVDWSLTIDTFNKGKKDSAESNLNFLTRLKGLWDTMKETCSREADSVIPHAYKDEPGLVAHSITLINKEMMAEIFKERIRDGKHNQMTTFTEFSGEILKYEQRSRAVNAMLGTVAAASAPRAAAARQPAGDRRSRTCRHGARRARPRCSASDRRQRPWRRRRPRSHSPSGARRWSHPGPRCGWSAKVCQ